MLVPFKEFYIDKLITEQFLLEDRISFLKKQFDNKLSTDHDRLAVHTKSDDIVDHFAQTADPSQNKMHTQWILNQYKNKHIRQEDSSRIKQALQNFDTHKRKLEKKDINQYKTLSDLENSVEPYLETPGSKKEQVRKIKQEGAELIYPKEEDSSTESSEEKSPVTVHHIKTKEAACHYGADTRWCTAGRTDNMFDHYNRHGPLYVIHARDENGNIARYQFHPKTDQFMDVNDMQANDNGEVVKRNPELLKVKEFNQYFPEYYDSNKKVVNAIRSGDTDKSIIAIRSPHSKPANVIEHLDNIKNMRNSDYTNHVEDVLKSPAVNTTVLHRILDESDRLTRHHILAKKIREYTPSEGETEKDVENLLRRVYNGGYSDRRSTIRAAAVASNYTPPDILKKALGSPNNPPDNDTIVREWALQNPKVPSETIHHVLSKSSPHDDFYKLLALKSPALKAEHVERLLGVNGKRQTDSEHIATDALKTPWARYHDSSNRIRDKIFGVNGQHIDTSSDPDVNNERYIKNTQLQVLRLSKTDPNIGDKEKNHIRSIVDHATEVEDPQVKFEALMHPYVSTHKRLNGFNSSVTYIKHAVISDQRNTPEQLDSMYDRLHDDVLGKRQVLGHINVSSRTIEKAARDSNALVRDGIPLHSNVSRNKVSDDLVKRLSQDSHSNIRDKANQVIAFRKRHG